MTSLILTFFRMSLFRVRPQDLPMSRDLLLLTAGAATACFILRNLTMNSEGSGVVIALAQTAVLGIMLYVLLRLFSKSERWVQSATALYGCSTVIVALAMPFLFSGGVEALESAAFNLTKVAILVISIWNLSVIAFILKETLEIRLLLAIVISVVFEITLAVILIQIFGAHRL